MTREKFLLILMAKLGEKPGFTHFLIYSSVSLEEEKPWSHPRPRWALNLFLCQSVRDFPPLVISYLIITSLSLSSRLFSPQYYDVRVPLTMHTSVHIHTLLWCLISFQLPPVSASFLAKLHNRLHLSFLSVLIVHLFFNPSSIRLLLPPVPKLLSWSPVTSVSPDQIDTLLPST